MDTAALAYRQLTPHQRKVVKSVVAVLQEDDSGSLKKYRPWASVMNYHVAGSDSLRTHDQRKTFVHSFVGRNHTMNFLCIYINEIEEIMDDSLSAIYMCNILIYIYIY